MTDLLTWSGLSAHSAFGIMMALVYPVLAVASLEIARTMSPERTLVASCLRQLAYLVLPTGAIWLILRILAELPPEDWAVRSAETAFALTGLYLLLRIAQAALMTVVDDGQQAPKLLLDILRIGLALIWGAVIVSSIWQVDLGSLFAAMGVGSIVLGFARQEFLGNLLAGLGLLSAHKFGIGDWIVVDGAAARVVEMDWRTVTLVKGGSRIVVANSTLAKGNLVLAARAGDTGSITMELAFGLDIAPERVRDAVMEAARALPALRGAPAVKCLVTGVTDEFVTYSVVLPVADPGIGSGPKDEFLSRFWYVVQRRGLRLGAVPQASIEAGIDDRLAMLQANGAFRSDAEALPVLARASAFQQYRRGDVLMMAGMPTTEAFFVVAGCLAVSIPAGASETRLELVQAGQLLVFQESLAGGNSPVTIVAHENTDVLTITAAAMHAVMDRNPVIARDVGALAAARRLGIQPLTRSLQAVA